MSASSTHSYFRGLQVKKWISEIASCARRFGRNPYEHGLKSASKMGSRTAFRLAWTTRSATVGTVTSYCDPFHVVCGLGLHFGGKLVAVGDSLFAAGLHVGGEVDPSASALAAAGG